MALEGAVGDRPVEARHVELVEQVVHVQLEVAVLRQPDDPERKPSVEIDDGVCGSLRREDLHVL